MSEEMKDISTYSAFPAISRRIELAITNGNIQEADEWRKILKQVQLYKRSNKTMFDKGGEK
jgi:hypothetical protein